MRENQRIATWGILGLTAVLIAGALVQAGDPMTAAKIHRDEQRISDVAQIWWQLDCMAQQGGTDLPKKVFAVPNCGNVPRLNDPYSGQSYVIEATGPHTARICATLELPDRKLATWQNAGVRVAGRPGCFDFEQSPQSQSPVSPAPEAVVPQMQPPGAVMPPPSAPEPAREPASEPAPEPAREGAVEPATDGEQGAGSDAPFTVEPSLSAG